MKGLIRDLDFFMDITKLIKAQQRIYDLDLDSNAKSLAMLLIVKAFQYGNGDEEFYLTDQRINNLLGVKDKHRTINARKVLVDKGFIKYVKGNNGKKTKYKVNWEQIIKTKQ